MPFYFHHTYNNSRHKNSITVLRGNMGRLCHILYFENEKNKKFYLNILKHDNKTLIKIDSLLQLLAHAVFSDYDNNVYSIYGALISKFGEGLIEKEFPNETFNDELIKKIKQEVHFMIADALDEADRNPQYLPSTPNPFYDDTLDKDRHF